MPGCDGAGTAERSYPSPRSGVMAGRSYLTSEVGAAAGRSNLMPEARGGGWEDQSHVQGAVAAQARRA